MSSHFAMSPSSGVLVSINHYMGAERAKTRNSQILHGDDRNFADPLDWKQTENPPPGSSGIQMRLRVPQMLDGFRPGRVVRLKGPWNYVLLPHDEWLMDAKDFERAARLNLP